MAKRKKKSGGGRRRSGGGKRVRGASMNDALMMALGGIAGGIGMQFATNKVTFLQGKIMGLVQVAAGALLTWKVQHPLVRGLGVGIAVAGGTTAAKGFGIITGIGAPRQFRQQLNGFAQGGGFSNMAKIGNPNIPGNRFPQPASVGKVNSRTYAGVYTN